MLFSVSLDVKRQQLPIYYISYCSNFTKHIDPVDGLYVFCSVVDPSFITVIVLLMAGAASFDDVRFFDAR